MLVTFNEMLADAKKGHYAVPAVNIDNDNNARAAIEACEEEHSPLILNVVPHANPDIVFFGRYLTELVRRSSQPIAINLDHGKTFEQCMRGVRAGFTTIMIDRSSLPFEENVKEVSEMVKICHSLGLSVEAELGHVGMANNYEHDGNSCLTVPSEAVEFVNQTDVDALAVAVGTAHGAYPKGMKPEIRYNLLHELADVVPVPLVLHGGSGTGDENLARCAREGISKINLSNDLKRAAIENLTKEDLNGNAVYQLYPLLAEGYKNKVKHFIELFGCDHKA